jgi:hypothetical protein
VDPDFGPDLDPEVLDEVDRIVKVVGFAMQVQAEYGGGFSNYGLEIHSPAIANESGSSVYPLSRRQGDMFGCFEVPTLSNVQCSVKHIY